MPIATLFPKHNIDPRKKKKEWLLQFAKAIWNEQDNSGHRIFHKNKSEYDLIKSYVLGDQPTEKYKIQLLGKDHANEESSLLAIDWTPRPIAGKLREIAISKILERKYNYKATPIDPLAKNEAERYYTEHKIKIMQREAALQANPDLLQNPAFLKEFGDPEDMEELEMNKEYGPGFKMATEAELAIQLIMYKNSYEEIEKNLVKNLVDYGVAGVIEDVDGNGEIYLDESELDALIMSSCKKDDFSDKTYWGQVKEVRLSNLASHFGDSEMQIIQDTAVKNVEFPEFNSEYNDNYDPFKVKVLHFRCYSWDETIFEQRVDARGNLVVGKTRYSDSKRNSKAKIDYEGDQVPQFKTKSKQVIYEGKWIIGTDFIYECGPSAYIKRSRPNRAVTEMGCHFHAYNFADMQASSIMKRLIPIIDEYQMTIYHIQNFKNKWLPYILDIDVAALENVALGGKRMSPKDLLNMVYKNFTLVSRRKDLAGQNVNYKAIDVQPTGMSHEYEVLVADLIRLYSEMRDIVGLNDITDASSPNPNLLNGVARLGSQATNNALGQIAYSRKKIGENTAKGVAQRVVKVIKKRRIEGLLPALGSESMKFISISPDVSLYDWGIMVEDIPTEEERQLLIAELNMKDANAQLEPEDILLIKSTQNIKQARTLLAYRLSKRKKQKEQFEIEKMRMNSQAQKESAVAAEKAKQETLELEFRLKKDLEMAKKDKDIELLRMQLESHQQVKETDVAGKITTQAMANENKRSKNNSEK